MQAYTILSNMPLIYSPRRWAAFFARLSATHYLSLAEMVLYPGEPFFLSESLVMYDCTCGQYKWKRLPRMPEAMYNGIGFAPASDLFVVAACWLVA
jgi:hypothetical protein